MIDFDFKRDILPHLIVIAAFLVLTFAYMSPLLQGKAIEQSDIKQFKGMAKEALDYKDKTGEPAFWTNSMFSGMPTYQITGGYEYNMFILSHVNYVFTRLLPKPANVLFLCLIGFYFLMIAFGLSVPLSVIGAISFAFSTNTIVSTEAGHMTKVLAMGLAPLVLMGIVLVMRKNKIWLGAALTALFLSFEIAVNHLQITYYLMLLSIIFMIFELAKAIREKEIPLFIKKSGVLLIAVILAAGANFTRMALTYEYSKETIRGSSELTLGNENKNDGLDYDYVTSWSYGLMETFTLLIPNFSGGTSEKAFVSEEGSETLRALRMMRNNKRAQQAVRHTTYYWGEQPFTAGTIYFGAIICMLFILGLIVVKGPFKWWLLAASILSILLAWGRNNPAVTQFFFDYFPLYNKFRTVTMILFIAQMAFPLLGIIAVHKILTGKTGKDEALRGLKIAVGITGGLCLVFALIPGAFVDFLSEANEKGLAQIDSVRNAVVEERKALMTGDAWRSLVFILLGGGALWFTIQEKLKRNWFWGILGVLILVDLWAIDKRYLNEESFITPRRTQTSFNPTPADQRILRDTDEHYRVLNLSVNNPFADASTSYFHKSIGGYHAAKMGKYQELVTYQISKDIQKIAKGNLANANSLNMLNTKYIIAQPKAEGVIKNDEALGNAWFVKTHQAVENADEEMLSLNKIDPEETVVYDQRFSDYFEGKELGYDPGSSIELTSYSPVELKYKSTGDKNQFAVFSEVYYNDSKGWKAYIDGKHQKHIRVNYVLRGMIIPAGEHEITFKFEPQTYYTAEVVSLSSSLLLMLGLLASIFLQLRSRNTEIKSEEKA